MSQVDYYSTGLRHGTLGTQLAFVDRLVRARVTAGGRNYRFRTGCSRRPRISAVSSPSPESSRTSWRHVHITGRWPHSPVERFGPKIVPVSVPERDLQIDTDEHPRPDASVEKLASLRPVLVRTDPESTVTAGNACGQSDGAARVRCDESGRATQLGLRALARVGELGGRRRASAHHGHRSGARHRPRARPRRPAPGRHGPDRVQRGVCRPGPRVRSKVAVHTGGFRPCRRQRLGDARSDIRSAPPVRGSLPPCSGSSTVAGVASRSRRCASVVARGSPLCSNGSADQHRQPTRDRSPPPSEAEAEVCFECS